MTKKASTMSLARLASSLMPRRNTLESQRTISALLLAEPEARHDQIEETKGEQHEVIGIEVGEVARLGDGAETDVLKPQRGKAHPDEATAALQGGGRIEIAGEIDRRNGADDRGDDDRGDL